MMMKLLLVAAGGGIGSVLRYLLAGWVQGPRLTGLAVFPTGTMAVNVAGSLCIGIAAAFYFAGPTIPREGFRTFIMIGIFGGFTTFSTFAYETLELVNDGQFARAGFNVLLTNALCLAAVWIGYRACLHIMAG